MVGYYLERGCLVEISRRGRSDDFVLRRVASCCVVRIRGDVVELVIAGIFGAGAARSCGFFLLPFRKFG